MLAFNTTFGFEKDVVPDIGMTGFSPPEDGFIWSTGLWCQLSFDLKGQSGAPPRGKPADGVLDVALDVDVFKAVPHLEGQNVFFYANGLRLASRFISTRVTVMLELPVQFVRPGENTLTIDTPDAAFPRDYGGTDTRRLGVQLFSVQVTGG